MNAGDDVYIAKRLQVNGLRTPRLDYLKHASTCPAPIIVQRYVADHSQSSTGKRGTRVLDLIGRE